MNFRIVFRAAGLVIGLIGIGMITSVPVGWLMNDPVAAQQRMAIAAVIPILIGLVSLFFRVRMTDINTREGYGVVVASWLAACTFGAIPYILVQGMSPADAFFESTSGFTTTGSSILTDIEALPKCLLYWRATTHWMGGMGIVVLALAILPILGIGGMQLAKAEAPSPTTDRLAPRIAYAAKLLWSLYVTLTVVLTMLLLISPKMNLFEAWCHACATIATGGFSTRNASIASFHSAYIEWVIALFMFLSSLSFALYLRVLSTGRSMFKVLWKDEEARFYTAVVVFSIATVAFVLAQAGLYSGSFFERLRHSTFAVVTLISTCGFATEDYDAWPNYARLILMVIMLMGGCSGSTSGGMKAMRVLLTLKALLVHVKMNIFPNLVQNIRLSDTRVGDPIMRRIITFCMTYLGIMLLMAALLLLVEPALSKAPPHGSVREGTNYSAIETAMTASIATLGGCGPGLADVGPTRNFGWMAPWSKVLMSLNMLLGRLEIYAILVVFLPAFWRE